MVTGSIIAFATGSCLAVQNLFGFVGNVHKDFIPEINKTKESYQAIYSRSNGSITEYLKTTPEYYHYLYYDKAFNNGEQLPVFNLEKKSKSLKYLLFTPEAIQARIDLIDAIDSYNKAMINFVNKTPEQIKGDKLLDLIIDENSLKPLNIAQNKLVQNRIIQISSADKLFYIQLYENALKFQESSNNFYENYSNYINSEKMTEKFAKAAADSYIQIKVILSLLKADLQLMTDYHELSYSKYLSNRTKCFNAFLSSNKPAILDDKTIKDLKPILESYYINQDKQKLDQAIVNFNNKTKQIIKNKIQSSNNAQEAYSKIIKSVNAYELDDSIKLAVKEYYKNQDEQKLERSLLHLKEETKQLIKMEIINCNTAEEAYYVIAKTLSRYESYGIIKLAVKDYYKNKDELRLEQLLASLDDESKQIIKSKLYSGKTVESAYNEISTTILKLAVKKYFDNVNNVQMLEREIAELNESTKELIKNKIQSSNNVKEAYNKIKHMFIKHESDYVDAFVNTTNACKAFGYNYDRNGRFIGLMSTDGQNFDFSTINESQNHANLLKARIFEHNKIKENLESFNSLKKYNDSLVQLFAEQEKTTKAVFDLISILDGKEIKKEVRKIYINELYKICMQEGIANVSPYDIKYLNHLREKINIDISFESDEYQEVKTALNDLMEIFSINDKKSMKSFIKNFDDKEVLKQLNIILSKRKDLNHIKINEQTVQKMLEISNLITQNLNSNINYKTKLQASIRSFKVIPVFMPKEYKEKVGKITKNLDNIKLNVDSSVKDVEKIHKIKYIPCER